MIARPEPLAGDEATSESALLHALDEIEASAGPVDVLVFLQATSPFVDREALARAIDRVLAGQNDVVFSAFKTYAFLWRETPAGATGVNHDHRHRLGARIVSRTIRRRAPSTL